MGTDKLLLPWQNSNILETVIDAWRKSTIDHIFVVIPKERTDLQEVVQALPVHVVLADPRPVDMKGSVLVALRAIDEHSAPCANDAWLVAPADMPTLSTVTIDQVLQQAKVHPGHMVIPMNCEKRGHPVLLPWSYAAAAQSLPENKGINALVNGGEVVFVDVEQLGRDIDTPGEYQQLRDTSQ